MHWQVLFPDLKLSGNFKFLTSTCGCAEVNRSVNVQALRQAEQDIRGCYNLKSVHPVDAP
ncbi:unnamed protein product [Musa acuminata var. zebrina]